MKPLAFRWDAQPLWVRVPVLAVALDALILAFGFLLIACCGPYPDYGTPFWTAALDCLFWAHWPSVQWLENLVPQPYGVLVGGAATIRDDRLNPWAWRMLFLGAGVFNTGFWTMSLALVWIWLKGETPRVSSSWEEQAKQWTTHGGSLSRDPRIHSTHRLSMKKNRAIESLRALRQDQNSAWETLKDARATCLQYLAAWPRDVDLLVELGFATLALEERAADVADVNALAFARHCLQSALNLGARSPELLASLLGLLPPDSTAAVEVSDLLNQADPSSPALVRYRVERLQVEPGSAELCLSMLEGASPDFAWLRARVLEQAGREADAAQEWDRFLERPHCTRAHVVCALSNARNLGDEKRVLRLRWRLGGLGPVRPEPVDWLWSTARPQALAPRARIFVLAMGVCLAFGLALFAQRGPDLTGNWKAVATVRTDGQRMPFREEWPLFESYIYQEATDYLFYVQEVDAFDLTLRGDGQASIAKLGDQAVEWSESFGSLTLRDAAGKILATGHMEEDGLQLLPVGRQLNLLLQRNGSGYAPLLAADWKAFNKPMRGRYGIPYLRDRHGRLFAVGPKSEPTYRLDLITPMIEKYLVSKGQGGPDYLSGYVFTPYFLRDYLPPRQALLP